MGSDNGGNRTTLVRTEMTRHEPSEGVLCWGGPHHGEVVVATNLRDEWRFAVPQRLSLSIEPVTPVGLAFQTVSYYRREFYMASNDGHAETWPVLVYGDGRERLVKNLETTMNFLLWLCSPFSTAHPGRNPASPDHG